MTEFFRQYAMIVLSILTALALERAAVAIQNASAARESRARIEAELARDTADLTICERANTENTNRVGAVLKALVEALKQGKLDQAKLLPIVKPAFEHINIETPSWQRDSWDTALADQSATHMAAADLRRYAEIYANERDLDATGQLLLGGEWLTKSASLRIDFALGTLDARAMADVMARYLLVVGQIAQSQKELEDLIAGHRAPPKATP
jgi:hypothetical protein